jgi:hypothetical protein
MAKAEIFAGICGFNTTVEVKNLIFHEGVGEILPASYYPVPEI